MKIGFAILSHKEPDRHFIRLLQKISEFSHPVIALHHDFSQSEFPDSVVNQFKLKVVEDYNPTKWGHISKIDATFKVFSLLSKENVDWCITLSPSCYPVKSINEIEAFLERAEADAYIDYVPIEREGEGISGRKYKRIYSKRIGAIPFISRKLKFYFRSIRIPIDPQNTPVASLQLYQCSDWFFINRKCLEFLTSLQIDQTPLYRYLDKINQAPDIIVSPIEILFQTLLLGNKNLEIRNDNYRYIDWSRSTNYHPKILVDTDWEKIRISNTLFARKFDRSPASQQLVDLIDNQIK